MILYKIFSYMMISYAWLPIKLEFPWAQLLRSRCSFSNLHLDYIQNSYAVHTEYRPQRLPNSTWKEKIAIICQHLCNLQTRKELIFDGQNQNQVFWVKHQLKIFELYQTWKILFLANCIFNKIEQKVVESFSLTASLFCGHNIVRFKVS